MEYIPHDSRTRVGKNSKTIIESKREATEEGVNFNTQERGLLKDCGSRNVMAFRSICVANASHLPKDEKIIIRKNEPRINSKRIQERVERCSRKFRTPGGAYSNQWFTKTPICLLIPPPPQHLGCSNPRRLPVFSDNAKCGFRSLQA